MRHHANNATCGRVRRGKASLLQRYTRRLAAIILVAVASLSLRADLQLTPHAGAAASGTAATLGKPWSSASRGAALALGMVARDTRSIAPRARAGTRRMPCHAANPHSQG